MGRGEKGRNSMLLINLLFFTPGEELLFGNDESCRGPFVVEQVTNMDIFEA